MPFPEMALLALIAFGALGTLLITVMLLDHSMHARAAKPHAAHPTTTAVTSGVGNILHPKPR